MSAMLGIQVGMILVIIGLPIFIAQIASSRGKYRLPVMLTLIVISWGLALLISTFVFISSGNVELISLMASNILIAIVIVVLATLAGNFLSSLIAQRYAVSVADALATVIAGISASAVMPMLSFYLLITQLPSISGTELAALNLTINFRIFITNFLLLASSTGAIAFVLMGWGTVSVLRRRKATIVGSASIILSVILSFLWALVISYFYEFIIQLNLDDERTRNGLILAMIVFANISILWGMLTAGLTVGIFEEIVMLLMFLLFVGLSISILASLNYVFQEYMRPANYVDEVLVFALCLVQLRAFMLDDKVINLLTILLLFFFFMMVATTIEFNSVYSLLILTVVFLATEFSLSQLGILLRQVRSAGWILTGLFVIALILVPLTALIA